MTLFALGINHNTATVDIREHLAFSVGDVSLASSTAQAQGVMNELAILSTCNRTEIYCEAECDQAVLLEWLADFKGLSVSGIEPVSYIHQDGDAVRHMMKVASGLDSLVLGEPQILGQMKQCYATSQAHQSVGKHLHSAFQQVFTAAKRVRSETAIGENPVSVAYAAVSLAQQIFSDLRHDTALLIGAGETVELLARHLHEQGIKKILVANRTLERAQRIAAEFNGEALTILELPEYLAKADIVLSSTASPLPLIGKGLVEQALKTRKHKPMFFVDIAVPRDIEPQVGELSDVFLYTVDDLKEVIDENKRSREQAAEIAQGIVEEGVVKYELSLREQSSVELIREFRNEIAQLSSIELEKALKNLQSGQDAAQVLSEFSRTLSNKFMHAPTAALKYAGAENDRTLIQSAKTIFALNKSKSSR